MVREVIVSAVLVRAVRDGVGALRSAGWRALALALLYSPAIGLGVAAEPLPGLLVVAYIVELVTLFAAVRLLAAHRPAGIPEPPTPVAGATADLVVRRVPPVGTPDRSLGHAAGSAVRLTRPALRLALIHLLMGVGVALLVVFMAGADSFTEDLTERDELVIEAGAAPIVALVMAFIGLAAQRIALEGDPRVLVALAHSVRIARAGFGPLFALALVESMFQLVNVAPGGVPVRLAGVIVYPLLQLVLTAARTELYLAGPRLDVPDDFGRRPRR